MGENLGKVGFRRWLVNQNITTLSDIMKMEEIKGFGAGDFDFEYKLVATGNVQYLFFKGPVYGTNLDHITMKSITVVYLSVQPMKVGVTVNNRTIALA